MLCRMQFYERFANMQDAVGRAFRYCVGCSRTGISLICRMQQYGRSAIVQNAVAQATGYTRDTEALCQLNIVYISDPLFTH